MPQLKKLEIAEQNFRLPTLSGNHIFRRRLLRDWPQINSCKLISIEARSGFGKTQFALEMALHFPGALVWMNVSYLPEYSDVCFLWNLYRAITQTIPSFGEEKIVERFNTLIQVTDTDSRAKMLVTIVDLLGARFCDLRPHLCIVLDDVQTVLKDFNISEIIQRLIDISPIPDHVVWVTVAREPIPYLNRERWQLEGKLSVICEEKLALNEVEQMAKMRRLGVVCDQNQRMFLSGESRFRRPYYCHLLGLQWRNAFEQGAMISPTTDLSAFAIGESDYALSQTEMLLTQENTDVQLFLCKTAVVNRLNIEQCNIFFEELDFFEKCLRELRHRDFFLQDRHDLTRQALLTIFEQRYGKTEVTNVYRQLGKWHEKAGQAEQAMRAYVTSGDKYTALRFMMHHAMISADQLNYGEIYRLLQVVPQSWHETEPVVMICAAIFDSLKPENRPQAQTVFQYAQTLAKQRGDIEVVFWAALEETHGWWQEEFYSRLDLSMPDLIETISDDLRLRWHRVKAEVLHGHSQYEAAMDILEEGIKLCERNGYEHSVLRCLIQKGWILNAWGRYQNAIQTVEYALELAKRQSMNNLLQAQLNYQLAWTRVDMGHADATYIHLCAIQQRLQIFKDAGYLHYLETYTRYRWMDYFLLTYDYAEAEQTFSIMGIDLNTLSYGWTKLYYERAETDFVARQKFFQVLEIIVRREPEQKTLSPRALMGYDVY